MPTLSYREMVKIRIALRASLVFKDQTFTHSHYHIELCCFPFLGYNDCQLDDHRLRTMLLKSIIFAHYYRRKHYVVNKIISCVFKSNLIKKYWLCEMLACRQCDRVTIFFPGQDIVINNHVPSMSQMLSSHSFSWIHILAQILGISMVRQRSWTWEVR